MYDSDAHNLSKHIHLAGIGGQKGSDKAHMVEIFLELAVEDERRRGWPSLDLRAEIGDGGFGAELEDNCRKSY